MASVAQDPNATAQPAPADDYFDVAKARAALDEAEEKLRKARGEYRSAMQLRMASKGAQRAGMHAVVVDEGQPLVGAIHGRDGKQYIALDDDGLRMRREAALEAIKLARADRDDALDRYRDARRFESDKAEDERKVKLDDLARQQTNAAKSLGTLTKALVAVGVLQFVAASFQACAALKGSTTTATPPTTSTTAAPTTSGTTSTAPLTSASTAPSTAPATSARGDQ